MPEAERDAERSGRTGLRALGLGAGLALLATATAAQTGAPDAPAEPPAPQVEAAPVPEAPAGTAPSIALSQLAEREWRVDYRLEAPTTALALKRNPDESRLSRWRPLDDGLEIVREGGVDVIRRTDGAPFMAAAFAAPATYASLPADYAPFSPFGDGGLLIHSGRFHACALACDEDGAQEWAMWVEPPRNALALTPGGTSEGPAEWIDSGEGTMIYVGWAQPIDTGAVLAVVDTAMPRDIRDRLETLFPRLMDFYAARLGALDAPPMLFMSWDRDIAPDGDAASSSYHTEGGTLPGQVFMHLAGDGWAEGDWRRVYPEGHFAWFFAHEAGHLYQRAAEFDSGTLDEAWIHEGGAEAFAVLALDALGAAPAGFVEGRMEEAAAQCAEGAADGPLSRAQARGAFGLHYQCGMIVQLAIDGAMRERSGGGEGLFDLWAAYVAALQGGAAPGAETFLPLVSQMAGAGAADFARRVAAGGPGLTLQALRDGSGRLGHPLPPYEN